MSNYEESKECRICMNEETIGKCISPRSVDEPRGAGCQHYACVDCWKRTDKCFFCRKELPIGFIKKPNEEILIDWITPNANRLEITQLELNDIIDLSPIRLLPHLEAFELNSENIVDITPLASLVNLTSLFLNDNRISDLTPLAILFNLKKLMIGFNRIVDFKVIESLILNGALRKFSITYDKTVDVSCIENSMRDVGIRRIRYNQRINERINYGVIETY
jgi:Leucine-rich repeat (LRR) protein